MIDIHSHIVFDVDDGPLTIKESIRMVLEAEKLGINEIIATPHYNNLLFSANDAAHNFAVISSRTADCDVKLHLGYEVSLNPFMVEKAEELRAKTLGGSSYLLFELPFDYVPIYSGELLYKLNMRKIIPILAHPERNKIFINNFDSLIKFLENECLVQIDAASIVGVYGTDARHIAEKMIKLNLAQFVASDAHCTEDYRNWYLPAYSQVNRWAGVEYSVQVFCKNAKKIVDDICKVKK